MMQLNVFLLIVLVFAAAVTGQKKQKGQECNIGSDCVVGLFCEQHQYTKKCTAQSELYGPCNGNNCQTGGNMTCVVQSDTTMRCECDSTHYAGPNDVTCTLSNRVVANAECNTSFPFQCAGSGSLCLKQSTSNSKTVCKVKGELYSECKQQSNCKTGGNMDCTNGLCVCKLEWYPKIADTGVCSQKRKTYWEDCDKSRECIMNYKCQDVTDKCVPNFDAGDGASFLQASVALVVAAMLAHTWPRC